MNYTKLQPFIIHEINRFSNTILFEWEYIYFICYTSNIFHLGCWNNTYHTVLLFSVRVGNQKDKKGMQVRISAKVRNEEEKVQRTGVDSTI